MPQGFATTRPVWYTAGVVKIQGTISPELVQAFKGAGLDLYTWNPPHPEGHRRSDAILVARRWPRLPRLRPDIWYERWVRARVFAWLAHEFGRVQAIEEAQWEPAVRKHMWTVRDARTAYAYGLVPKMYGGWYPAPDRRITQCPMPGNALNSILSVRWTLNWHPGTPSFPQAGYIPQIRIHLTVPPPHHYRLHFSPVAPTGRYVIRWRRGRQRSLVFRAYSYHFGCPSFRDTRDPWYSIWKTLYLRQQDPAVCPSPGPIHMFGVPYNKAGDWGTAISPVFVSELPPGKFPGLWLWPVGTVWKPWAVYDHYSKRHLPAFGHETFWNGGPEFSRYPETVPSYPHQSRWPPFLYGTDP